MSTSITGSAADREHGISVEVGPGGALRSLDLTPESLRLGRSALASSIVGLVGRATAQANQRARHALRDQLDGLSEDELSALGITQDAALTEAAESTTPDTWRA